nr:SMI1/KNR4 family protein [Paenibacillus turpanensis]
MSQTLSSLKERIAPNGELLVQQEQGYCYQAKFIFHEPATESEIDEFISRTGWRLPEDYRLFLLTHNGAKLFKSKYGGGYNLFTLDEIIRWRNSDAPANWYPIASHLGDLLFVDFQEKDNSDGYLYWMISSSKFEWADKIRLNFETWLDRLIVAQGVKYWEWNRPTIL